jgi:hypothetical protein
MQLIFNVIVFENGRGTISISSYWESVIRGAFLLIVVLVQARGKETPAMTEQSQHALDRNDEHVAEATEGVAPMVAGVPVRLASLMARAEALADSGQRRILGITGAPGSGKGTVAQAVLKALGRQRS